MDLFFFFLGFFSHLAAVVAAESVAPLATTEEQIKKASTLIKRIDLRDFSACQFVDPSLRRCYGHCKFFALEDNEMPDIKDETLPDEEGISRPGIVKAIEVFKTAVCGEVYNE